MVLFSNIALNQHVEVSFENQILKGTVRYKGAIKGQAGDWVGVELDEPIGKHNGLYKGVKYFECRINHGVFVRASSLRFIKNVRRRLYNKYHRRWGTGVDETLFGSSEKPTVTNSINDPIFLSDNSRKQTPNDLFDTLGSRYSPSRMSFHLSQPISRRVPAATMTRPYTAAAAYTYTSQPVNLRGSRDKAVWEPTATIPKTHMPHSAQKNQTMRGWHNSHWTRELSYSKARHSMKSGVWNDVSF